MNADLTSRRREHLAAVVFLAVVATATLARGCLLGEIPYDTAYQSAFHPWRTPAAATPLHPNIAALAPAPERDPLDRYRLYWARLVHPDTVIQVWPEHLAVRNQVRKGHLPLWQPALLGGSPLMFNGMTSPLLPISWPAFLFSAVRGLNLTLWLHLFLAGAAFYALLIERGRRPLAAAGGAVAYMLNPLFMLWLFYGSAIPIMGLLPLAIVAMGRLVNSPRPWHPAAALALLTALYFYAGNLQFAIYALLGQALAALWLLSRASDVRRIPAALWIAGATLAGVLAASVVILPFLELVANAARSANRYQGLNFLPPTFLIAWLFPGFFGDPSQGDFVGGFLYFRPSVSLYGGIGSLAMGLAVVGAIVRRRRLLGYGAVALLLVLAALRYDAIHAFARTLLPSFDSAEVIRVAVLVYFAAAVLVADGLDVLGEQVRATRAALTWLALLAITLLVLEVVSRATGADAGRFFAHLAYLRRRGAMLLDGRLAWPIGAGMLVAAAFWLGSRAPRWGRLVLPTLVVGLCLEALLAARPLLCFAPASEVLPEPPTLATLRQALARQPGRILGLAEPDTFPFYTGDNLPPNTASALGFEDLRGFRSLPPAPMFSLLAAASPMTSAAEPVFQDADLPVFDLLNVRYVLSAHALDPGHFEPAGPSLWRNLRAGPRAFFTPCVLVMREPETRLRLITHPRFNPVGAAVVGEEVPGIPACAAAPPSHPILVDYPSPTQAHLHLDAPSEGVVVLADAWYPGWIAQVDGVAQEPLRVDHALRGAVVPRGSHEITFTYQPTSLADGAALSLLGLLLIVGAAGWKRWPRLSDDALVAIGAAVLLAAFAWREPLPNDNDALYADVIRAIRQGGHFIALQINGVPFLDKPPLFFWLGAAATAVFGESAFVLRLPAMVAGIFGVVLVARMARRFTDSRAAGFLAAALLLSAPTYFEYARRVYMEVPVAVAGLYACDLGLRERWKRAGLWAGLAFLLKSVVGLLGAASLVVALLVNRRLPRGLLVATGVALAVSVPWHVLAYLHDPATFLDFTLRLHVVDQIAAAQPWSTGGPLFYLSAIASHDSLLGVMMVVGLLVAALGFRGQRPLHLLVTAVAVVLQILLYSLSATKKPFYLLTAYPFAAILGAWALHRLLGTQPRRIALAFGLVAAAFVATCGPLLYPDVTERESTYLRPLAERAAALAPPGRALLALDVYLAAPQFYGKRPVVYAVRDERVQRMLSRIPYLRYARNVVTWQDGLLAGGNLAIAPVSLAQALVAQVPGAEVVARNEAFWLVRGPS